MDKNMFQKLSEQPENFWVLNESLNDSCPSISQATIFLNYKKNPPILQDQSTTTGVPYKHWFNYTKPSERIASSYTPNLSTYRINDLSKKRCMKKKSILFNRYNIDCKEFNYSSIKYLHAHKQEIINKNTKKIKLLESEPNNIVSLVDLVDGTWYKRKMIKNDRKIMKKNNELIRQQQDESLKKTFEIKDLQNRQADLPRSIESQRSELLGTIEKESNENIKFETVSKLQYLINQSIKDFHLEPYDYLYLEKAQERLSYKLKKLKYFNFIFKSLELEIINDYKQSIRFAIVDYILLDPLERKRLLNTDILPIQYPVMHIRAPVPWHNFFVNAAHYNEHNLFIGNEILRDIRELWFSKYHKMRIIQLSDFGKFPVPALELESLVDSVCNNTNKILLKEWLADVAELFIEKKYAWSYLLEKKFNTPTALIEKYFRSTNILLSQQLRIIVIETLKEMKNFLIQYKNGNKFEKEYYDLLFIRTPFIRITVEPVLGSTELRLNPNVMEMYNTVSRCFDRILLVGSTVPKIEAIIFPEFQGTAYLLSVSRDETLVSLIINEALESIVSNKIGPELYLKCYNDLLYILNGQANESLNNYFKTEPIPSLQEFGHWIDSYDNLSKEICLFRNKIPLNMIEIDCKIVNDTMRNILYDLRSKICDYFLNELRLNNHKLCHIFEEIAEKISGMPETTQEVVDLFNFLCDSRDNTMFSLRNKLNRCGELIIFLLNYQPPSDEDIQLNTRTLTWPNEMEVIMELATKRLNMRKEFVEGVLRKRRDNFEIKIQRMQQAIDIFKKKDPPVLTVEEMIQSTEEIEKLSINMTDMRQEAEQINNEEGLLDIEITPYLSLPSMLSTVDTFDTLWHTVLNFHKNYERWYYGPFSGLNAEQIREETDNTWKILYKLGRALSDTPGARRIAEMIRGKVEKFKQFIPVLQTICTPGLQERHWELISKVVNTNIIKNEKTSLSDMIEYGLSVYIDKLEEISSAATKEHLLEGNLKKMKTEWEDVYFDLIPYRDTGVEILSAVDDVQMLLDDHILKAQTMHGSPFVKAFENEIESWETKLISMQDIIDQWLTCQATWMYLEPIFSSEDIMRQMPVEAKNFCHVDKIWRTIMNLVSENKKVTVATSIPNMFEEFKLCNQLLDEIQKGLNDYLEKKRLFFPRFFFLSNDELLEILSETKDPQRVQPHLKKCFEGIYKLRFTNNDEIIGMLSAEEEYVPMSVKIYPADAKGMVEKWLCQVEEIMITSLRDIAQDSIISYFTAVRHEWIVSWPGQIVLCSSQIHWTSEVIESFKDNSTKAYLNKCSNQIDKTITLIRSKLDSGTRITLNALIVIEVHARDIVKLLVVKKVNDPMDFNWISQLRYYWLEGGITVSMITTDVEYGFEYLGNAPRLVITPLTDRCYRTLMSAMKLNLGGAPEGPAGTGKTETSKDLAKAVAKQCIVFNCSEGLNYKAMGKFFKGLAQSGAWSCFDEFNRIELEVLSVIAQQILTIQMAISIKSERFIFEGTEIKLNPTCNILITMNPGYAGRQELPDNLKVLFRTVAMMIPDYSMIGEITLYSYGFTDAKNLADKIVFTYKLCSEQLSLQRHYDYGMRAVKTVLDAAGNLKLKYKNENESSLILRAIIDVNLPKFLSDDIPLFNGIYNDLFPGVQLPQPDRNELIELLKIHLDKKNLQGTSWYIDKIIQIYEMILVRHGLMIVGDTLGGKTEAYKILADALGDLSMNKRSNIKEFKTIYRVINPKAISIGLLYGNFDPVSHEWKDGVIANTFREYAQSLSFERKWIIFDGPVDAVWIENMNTVLDDNKKLCLMSGEIIIMSKKMNMIFEPADLDQASPATVSRCGMIYMEPSQLGWQSIFESFKKTLKEKLLVEQFELAVELIEWLTKPIFYFIRHNCQTFVNVTDIYMFLAFTKIFNAMLEDETQISTIWLQCTLLFSIVWGFASTLISESKHLFDTYLRDLLLGNIEENPKPKAFKLSKQQIFPDRGSIYEWIYDKRNNGTWISWIDLNTAVPLPADTAVNELIMPTNEVLMQKFFMKKLLERSIPILFIGPTGTGKSSVVLNYLINLPKDKYIENVINFSAYTSAAQTQEVVMSKLDRRRKGVYGPTMGKKCILFVDDLNRPLKETYGAQPPIELLRQWIDHGHWFDPKDTSMLYLVDILMIGAMGSPGGRLNSITSRFIRHMHVIGIDTFDDNTITKIFTSILDWHFSKGFESNISRLSKMIVAATIDIYNKSIDNFLPIPAKSHYTFNLRDFSRVINGIVLVPAARMRDPDKLIKLWIHEVFRVFHDRLVDDDDRNKLFEMVKNVVNNQLHLSLDKVLNNLLKANENSITSNHICDLLFGMYMEPDADPKIYDEVIDLNDLQEKMNYHLIEYNKMSNNSMSLVLFRYAIEHISRISRIIMQSKGNGLLVGIGGSGRSSCSKLAASICEYDIHQVEITKNYGINEWRDDLKLLLHKAGCDGKSTVFLFSDNQIKDESFLEDINIILNTGDIPNLYTAEEKIEILDKIANIAQHDNNKKIETTPMALYSLFIERVKKYLHIIITMSPIGNTFRNRIRMFPSLINCCTIDWYLAWPSEALEEVATVSLQSLDIDSDIRNKCVINCKNFHQSVQEASYDYEKRKGRINYVTPTSFLKLIKSLAKLYVEKVEQIISQQNRYIVGLEKLNFAAGQVSVMQNELHELQPKLVSQSQLSDKLMIKIEQDTVNVEAKKEIVAADEALANEAAAAAQAIKDDCESDLAEATPALEAALAALNTLKPADITIVKSMKSPPAGVRLVMEAVCVLKGVKPERVQDPSGFMVDDYWPASIKLLGDIKFLESLKNFDKDNIPPGNIKKIREKFMNDRSFQPEVIKKVSTACEGLCKWIRAMEVYDRVIKVVAPKKAMLAEAEAELAAQMETLNAKRTLLQEVTDKLQTLNDEFAECMREKKKLEDQIDHCMQKLDRAEKLLGGLGGERTRWSNTAANLGDSLINVIGDVLLASGILAYLGAFTVDYRNNLIKKWHNSCKSMAIPCSDEFKLADIIGDPVEIRNWMIQGLPADNYSIENGIIVKYGGRWPLMIDPQGQANKWIKNMEKSNKLSVIKLTDVNYVKIIEQAIQIGTPILLENILDDLDAILEPVLLKTIYKQSGIFYLKFNESILEYNNNFKFYITTRLRNPHYLPEIAIKVNIINFMITQQGLQDQLLGIVVAKDLPALEDKKNQLIIEGANNKRILKDIEDKILQVLSSSEGNILEDETAIKILSSSKLLSEDIQSKQKVSAKTTIEIDQARDAYKPVSRHGAILFFCIADLASIDPMYQYSLPWFINLYIMAISNSKKSDNLNVRLESLNSIFTLSIYKNICRSLFDKDKLIFSLVLTVGIMRADNKIEQDLWHFFLTGGVALEDPFKNPDSSWISNKSWSEINRASQLTGLQELNISFEKNLLNWKAYYDLSNPEYHDFPSPFNKIANGELKKLVILRCIRPDKLVSAVEIFIKQNMGQLFIEPPPFDLQSSYDDSNNTTPLIFILSSGSDPMAKLIKFAETKGISRKNLLTISLGQGQGPLAVDMISKAIKNGEWVVLQNCHLAESWMKQLDSICDELIAQDNTHSKFRMWLTSYPSKVFPVSILQNGIKMIYEPPKGLKQNLLHSYLNDPLSDMEFFQGCFKISEWRSLLFSLCFFHAVVQERRKFGPLGWNIPYEFDESDLRISVLQLQVFLNEYEQVPLDALTYLTGECNYGGRITDDKDRRLLNALLKNYYNMENIEDPKIYISLSGDPFIPKNNDYEGFLRYINSLPLNQKPEVYGLHDNADITKDNNESMQLLAGVLLTQTQIIASGNEDNTDTIVSTIANEILFKIPEQFNIEAVSEMYPVVYKNSMNTVLKQELIRFNDLIKHIKDSLINLLKAIKGQIVISTVLEQIYTSISIGQVPKIWSTHSYPSLKPLGSYISDLLNRIKFFQDWIDNNTPNIYWISGFFFTQSFLTGILQNYARHHEIPIDLIDFEFEITKYSETFNKPPDLSVFIKGLFLEGARWNEETQKLDESKPKVIFDVLPIIWIKPGLKTNFKSSSSYLCPVYKTTARRGELTTTGHSSNFVMFITIPTDINESHWITRGVASITQLDD
ncbi:dynein axonemal heavy chain 3 [Microplitis demolitor]|uniref:dynein axonemal heavy chain 3 n=1 Tax=Microplitis demolitor TaxID=69319 RepID=UPI00235B687F|nr:dynein axonemal heavy chain 3 [Microplitis demolitor]